MDTGLNEKPGVTTSAARSIRGETWVGFALTASRLIGADVGQMPRALLPVASRKGDMSSPGS